MKSKLPGIVVAIALFFALASIALALVYRGLLKMVVYDYNFQTFHYTLTQEQRNGIVESVRIITGLYTMTLVFTNGLWLAAALFLLSRLQKRRLDSPNQTLHAPAATPSS